MALGQRAALIAVGLTAMAVSGGGALVYSHIPDNESSRDIEPRVAVTASEPAEKPALPFKTKTVTTIAITPSGDVLVTGALPPLRQTVQDNGMPTVTADGNVSRFTFVPPNIANAETGWLTIAPGEGDVAAWATETHQLTTAGRANKAGNADQPTTNKSTLSQPGTGRRALHKRFWSKALKKRLAQISPGATRRLEAKFGSAKVAWPPAEVALIAIKDKKTLELHARGTENGPWKFIHRYPVLAASGGSGPKLLRGDKQVPEGVYRISYLNPNSRYHVSMKVNYPNEFDRQMAREDNRRDLGGDIMIHGKKSSAGCLAMGDAAAEELFVLSAEVGTRNMRLVIAPTDFRKSDDIKAASAGKPAWTPKLYAEVAGAMSPFKAPAESPSLLSLLGL
ncbi:MAG: murein L,D-transpeptidase family protein [Hyphomicrobiaceae bacterium]